MDIATIRDIIIIIYGSLGIILCIMFAVLALLLFLRVYAILNDVMAVMNKIKTITNYVSKEIIAPLIELSVVIHSATDGLRKIRKILTGKGGNE